MKKFVTDSMVLILRLENRKMPKNVKEKFEKAEKGRIEIIVPSLVFAELAYLSERNRIDTNLTEVRAYLDENPTVYKCSLSFSTVNQAFDIDDIPELHDRLIAGAGKELNIPILTNDPDLLNSKYVDVIWK